MGTFLLILYGCFWLGLFSTHLIDSIHSGDMADLWSCLLRDARKRGQGVVLASVALAVDVLLRAVLFFVLGPFALLALLFRRPRR